MRNIYLSTYCLYQGFNIMLCILNNIKDVASHEPILNPVLNREGEAYWGRHVLISLIDHDIDISPCFTIFLSSSCTMRRGMTWRSSSSISTWVCRISGRLSNRWSSCSLLSPSRRTSWNRRTLKPTRNSCSC